MSDNRQEPWLSGTLTEVPPVHRALLHSLELAKEDAERWCSELNHQQLNASPAGVASPAFHLRHIPGSIDRLLTYAEGRQLSDEQLAALKRETHLGDHPGDALIADFKTALDKAAARVRALESVDLNTPRAVGRKQLPTTVGGLLIHIAEHTQRHVGQLVTTVKLIKGKS